MQKITEALSLGKEVLVAADSTEYQTILDLNKPLSTQLHEIKYSIWNP